MDNDKTGVHELTLTDVADRLAKGEVSPIDLVEASLQRAEEISGLNAFTAIHADEAREVAHAAGMMLAAGHRIGPLHGIPIAVKDNIAEAGRPNSAGSKILADHIADRDATVTARLKSAGAIIIGRTNMHEFAWGGTSDNPHFGTVRNPWNPDRFPAGSSGGSGVAVAARACFGALGTDTGGSVRLPASVNGIVGLRPTVGRVSNAGVIPLAWSMDTVGPMARTVSDCAMLFNAIAGHDPIDPGTADVRVPDYTAGLLHGVDGLRIGIVPDYFLTHLQPPVLQSLIAALGVLESAGARIVDTIALKHIHGNISAQLTIEAAEPSSYHQKWLRERPDDYGDDVRLLLETGETLLATHYIQAQRYRSLLRAEMMEAFDSVDVFICPTLPFTATPVGETTVEIEPGVPEDMLGAIMQFTGVPSLTGLPAMSVPCGFDDDGMPIGMQIIGKPFDEPTLFRVGAAFERASNLPQRSPA